MRATIAVWDKKGNEAPTASLAALECLKTANDYFEIAVPGFFMLEKDIALYQKKGMCSQVAIASVFSESQQRKPPQFMKLEGAAFAFEGRIYSQKSRMTVTEKIGEGSKQELIKAVESLVRESEGDFALVVAEQDRILAARDPIGVQPFYYGENDSYAAVGSNRKVLWRLGIQKANSFPPGHTAIVGSEGFNFKSVKALTYAEPKLTTMQEAAFALQKLLERSVRLRVQDIEEAAVAFSGGLDSSIVAFLAKKCGISVHLVHVSLRNRAETEEAKKAAEELGLPLSVLLFEEEDVEKVTGKVVELIEEPDPVNLAIGIPFYWTAERASKVGLKVLLAGQGADELFGGYQRYVSEYCLHGEEKTRRTMFADVTGMHESNLERDEKICNFHSVELRLPFASYRLAEFANSLPIGFKIEAKVGSLRKLVLRKVAEDMGLPTVISMKPKKAVQYATGINDALKKLAKKESTSLKEYASQLFTRQF